MVSSPHPSEAKEERESFAPLFQWDGKMKEAGNEPAKKYVKKIVILKNFLPFVHTESIVAF